MKGGQNVHLFSLGVEIMEKAILVGLHLEDAREDIHESMEELKNLALACEIESVDTVIQNAKKIIGATYIGTGKVKEVKMAVDVLNADLVIFNDELSPAQIRNLERELDTKVIDRSLLILNIFATRAKTKEAMLEVELAQLRYMLPRLIGLSSSLSRQGGAGFNAKGPGEKKLELDRRIIENQISRLKNELDGLVKNRETQKQRRQQSNIPVVALVGYTNAGKSATLNSIYQRFMHQEEKIVFEKDMLFATLGTHTRRIKMDNNQTFLLVDTVGFISKLPTHLIKSFRSTLEEVLDADLILHVVDASNKNYPEHLHVTHQVLRELGADTLEQYYVFNKADLLHEQFFLPMDNAVLISNKTGFNMDLLINVIKEKIKKTTYIRELLIPYSDGKQLNFLLENATIFTKQYTDNGTLIKVELDEYLFKLYKHYEKN